jgi:sugar/nucleoside kinase (ribokinase family)
MAIAKKRRVAVFGPAYLDRVLRVDRPLIDPALGPPIDQSVDGEWKFGTSPTLEVVDPGDYTLEIVLPGDWPGPTGEVYLERPIREGVRGRRIVRGLAWQDDLGGMGAGYAAALNGTLWSALGQESDPTGQAIARRLAEVGIDHQPIHVTGRSADWTLLISSGEFGDKLPIGFRGCHAALTPESLDAIGQRPCDLRVVASLPNHLAAHVLRAPGAPARFFAPAMRNMRDRDCPISSFAASIDILSCNRREWETLEDREEVAWQVSILVVTDGPDGSTVRFTTPTGEAGLLRMPAFPRQRPPRDTNRAGESYAATLVSTLLDRGWSARSGVVETGTIRLAAARAAVAAALQLDRVDFGFPSPAEIDSALRACRIP